MRVIFFGTSSFAARTLRYLAEHQVDICAIVTRPDRPKGRSMHLTPPPVKETALALAPNIPIYQPEKASTPEFEHTLRAHHADLFVVVAYGEIIKQHLLDIPPLGCINIHGSLLPKYRGAAPIQRALMDGVAETGMTIIKMTQKMDAGDILAIASIPVSEETTFGELEPKLCDLGCMLVVQVIDQYTAGTTHPLPQDHTQATLAPKITPEDEVIDWTHSAKQIHNQVRALSPAPAAWFTLRIGTELKRIKVKRTKPHDQHGTPGQILTFSKQGWIIACGSGALQLLEVQPEGKKAMPASDFIQGIRSSIEVVV